VSVSFPGNEWRDYFVIGFRIGLVILLFGTLLYALSLLPEWIQHDRFWVSLPRRWRLTVEGTVFAAFGIFSLKARMLRREKFVSGVWDFKMFLFDVALLIGGAAALIEALRGRSF
jgi:hypothetical protein